MGSLVPGWMLFHLWPVFMFISRLYFLALHAVFCVINAFKTRQYVTEPTDRLQLISATQAVRMIAQREITSYQLVDSYIRRIEQINPTINAMVVKLFDEAKAQATECDRTIVSLSEEELQEFLKTKPLYGVPFTMKDAFELDGVVITSGIYNRKNTKCDRTSETVQRMIDSGAILLGVTNVPEVCMWVESVNNIYGRTCNPYDSRRMCGGSSGGEAALISSCGSVIGVGSDIGGSIRMPSFFNGVFGMKPTPGIIPLDGHIPSTGNGYRSEMLRVGPICRYAEDLPLLLKIMAGPNSDKLRLDEPVARKKLRLFYMEGIQASPIYSPLSYEMRQTLRKAVKFFERKYDLVAHKIDLPFSNYAIDIFNCSMTDKTRPEFKQLMLDSEGKSGAVNCWTELVRFVTRQSKHTLPAIITGIIDSFDYPEDKFKEFIYMRERTKRQLKELLGDDGILLFPSWPSTALYHVEPILAPLNFVYTGFWNTLALPAVQCPMGLDSNGLPLGVQVIGNPYSDRLLIAAAQDLEEGFNGWQPAKNL